MQRDVDAELARAHDELVRAVVEGEAARLKLEALRHVKAAQVRPTEEAVSEAIEAMERFEAAARSTLGVGTAIGGIIAALKSADPS